MYKSKSSNKRLLIATCVRYSKQSGKRPYPVTFTFYSSSNVPRNLNDIAARYAWQLDISWHHIIVRDSWGKTLSQRYRLGYRSLIK